MKKITIPCIKNIDYSLDINLILGVQPMSTPTGFNFKFKKYYSKTWGVIDEEVYTRPGYVVIEAHQEVVEWIKSQPTELWKRINESDIYYLIAEELLTLIALKWKR